MAIFSIFIKFEIGRRYKYGYTIMIKYLDIISKIHGADKYVISQNILIGNKIIFS